MSLFLKSLSTSFFRAVVSSRPIFNKATSLFASIAINANKQPRLPINTIGTAHARSICFGSPFERKNPIFLRKLFNSRTYSKNAKKSPDDCKDASKTKTPDKTKKDSSKPVPYVCEDLKKSAAKAKTPDKTKKPSKGASNIKLSAKGIKCAVEKEGILCYIDCKELGGGKGDSKESKDQAKGSKQSKSEGDVCKKPSEKDLKKSKTVGDVRGKGAAKKTPPAPPPPKKKKKKQKLLPDDDADVKAMTGTWVSKKCLKFDFTCGGKVVKAAGTEPVKLEDCDEEELKAQTEEDCYMESKSEGAADQSPLKMCIQQCMKNIEHKNMSTKSGNYDDECEEKPKRKSKKHKKKKKKKSLSKKKDEDCKPCSSKKEGKGKSKKKAAAAAAAAKKEEEESKAFETIEQLTKELCECKRSLAKLKAEFDGTAGECQPAPKLDKKLPKPKKQDKDVVNCSKSLLQSVCDGIKASKSAPSVSKSKSVKDVKKSKSADCTQSKGDNEKPKKKVSDFCKGKEKGKPKGKSSDKVSATVKATQKPKPKRSPPCKYESAKSAKKKPEVFCSDECKPSKGKEKRKSEKGKDECEDKEKAATKAKDDECEDEKKLARKKSKEERLRKLLCANDDRKKAAKGKSKQAKDPEPEEYCTEPKKPPEPKKEKPKIKTACELEKSGKRTKRRMICTDDPDRNPKHEPKENHCLKEFGKSQKKPKEICAKPKPKKSDDCEPKKKKSKSDICKPVEKKPSKSKSDTGKKASKSKSDICKPAEKKPSKSKSDTGKASKSKSDICKPPEKKPSKSKSDTGKASKSKSDICKPAEKKPSKSKSDTGKASDKKTSKSDPCKSLEKKPSKSKSDTSKSLEKKKSKSKSNICETPKTKPLCKPKIAEAGQAGKKKRFPEYCPTGEDEPKSSKSLPPDQSPIMQCIALCKKKMKANKPQEGKGVPPRDKKPCTTDKKVFKKLVEFSEEANKQEKSKGDKKDPCKDDKKASKKAKKEETDKCGKPKEEEIKQFVPCKTEEIKPGIREGKGEGDDKVECPPKKKKAKIPDCPPESQSKENKKEEKEVKKKEAKEAKEKKAKDDEEVKVEQNEAKCVKFPFSCKKEDECEEEIDECKEEKEECQEEKEECQEEKIPENCVEKKDPCEDTKKKKEDDCD